MAQDATAAKTEELRAQVDILVQLVTVFREYVKPDFDVGAYHQHFDPILNAAYKSHDIYHELLALQGHAGH